VAGRNTPRRDRHRATIAATKPPCAICGQPIDYTLKWPHPDCYVVDHITPIDKGGPDTLPNKQAAHHRCNREKSNKPVSGILRTSGVLQ
jgi:gp95